MDAVSTTSTPSYGQLYRQAVARGRRALSHRRPVRRNLHPMTRSWMTADREASRWELGDIAVELQPIGASHVNSGALDGLNAFAADISTERISIKGSTLREYRRVSAAWPEDQRGHASWSVYARLAGRPDRIDVLAKLIEDGDVSVDAAVALTAAAPVGTLPKGTLPTLDEEPSLAEQYRSLGAGA